MTRIEPDYDDEERCPEEAVLEACHRGELDEAAAARVRQHLAQCERCRAWWKELAEEQEIGELLREARQETPPPLRARLIETATTVILGDARPREE